MKIMVTSFKMPHAPTAALSAPTLQQASASPRLHQRLLDTHGQIGSVSCGVAAPLSWAPVHTRFCLCLPRVYFPILCKFWWLYGANGDLLQEGLCHTQVCCTQGLCHCSWPLQISSSRVDTQKQFWLHLCGVSGSWYAQGLYEPSEHLWWVWGLILNVILPHLSSC